MKSTTLLALWILSLVIIIPTSFANSVSLEYDANGNVLSDGTYNYEYNDFNRLSKIFSLDGGVIEQYWYDHTNKRYKKDVTLETGEVETTLYLDENLVRVINATGSYDTYYYYDNAGTLLAREDDSGTFYYHPDHLGSTSLVTDEEGEVVEETSYLPFGSVLEGGNERYGYTGKEKDDTGLMYYGARYYNPTMRRFTQPDSIIPDLYNPQSLNRYSYVLNNPYKYVDPSGNDPVEFWEDLPAESSWVDTVLYDIILPTSYEAAEQHAIDSSLGVVTENHAYKDYLPGTGDRSDAYGAVTGETYYGNDKLSGGERVLAGVLAILPFATYKQVKGLYKGIKGTKNKGAVIGKMDDIAPEKLSKGERTLTQHLSPNLGSPKANWYRNSQVLRYEIRK